MPMSKGMIAGIGGAILAIIIIIYFASTSSPSDELPNPNATPGMVKGPPCTDFKGSCPENQELNREGYGETAEKCCHKKLCIADICKSNNNDKDLKIGARGDTIDECCVDPICSAELCNVGWKLSPRVDADKPNIGRDNAACCVEKAPCPTNFECPGGYDKKSDGKGDSVEDCCVLRTCSANGWAGASSKCPTGLKPDATKANKKGNTPDVCCRKGNCQESEYTDAKCNTQKTGYEAKSDLDKIIGNTADLCCKKKKCSSNGWTKDKCLFESGRTLVFDSSDPPGNTKEECCKNNKCSDLFFYDVDCDAQYYPDDIANYGNVVGEGDSAVNTANNPVKQTDANKKCFHSGTSGKGNCNAYNRKLVSGDVMAGENDESTKMSETCCKKKTCGEYKADAIKKDANKESEWTCQTPKIFNGSAIPNLDSSNNLEDKIRDCCSDAKCPDKFKTDDDCKNAAESATIGALYELDGDSSSKEASLDNCCKPKKCKDVIKTNDDCGAESKVDQTKRNTPVDPNNPKTTCCENKKCNEVTHQCPSWMKLKAQQPNLDKSDENCCEAKKCDDPSIGWTNAKCRDKNNTRALHRGKLKPNAVVSGPNQKPFEDGGGSGGDSQCCQQDLKNNFARHCVGEEWHRGNLAQTSIGVNADPHLVKIREIENTTPEECKRACINDDRCDYFTLAASLRKKKNLKYKPSTSNPTCTLHNGFAADADINNKIVTEFSSHPVKTSYISGEALPNNKRYSGGSVRKTGTTLNRNSATQKSPTRRGYNMRNNWSQRRNILLAGVDKEFCPYKYIKAYGVFNAKESLADGGYGVADVGGTWHPPQNSDGNVSRMTEKYKTVGNVNIDNSNHTNNNQHCIGNAATSRILYPSEILDQCWNKKDCHTTWISPHGHVAGGADLRLGYQTRWDPGSSRLFNYTAGATSTDRCKIEGSAAGVMNHGHAKRRHCPKKAPDKSIHKNPSYIKHGGASMMMSREVTGNNIKLGVMPYKIRLMESNHWKPMLINGDSSDI